MDRRSGTSLARKERVRSSFAFDAPARARRMILAPAAHDWILGGYYSALAVAAYLGHGDQRDLCLRRVVALLLVHVLAVVLVRSELVRGRAAGIFHRTVTYGGLQLSYFVLRPLLPVATSRSYDAALHRIDVRLFGVEPTLAVDRFVSPLTTEWFSFFYFGYFVLLAVHVFPMLALERRPRLLEEFALSLALVFCTAHLTYMLVPGYGPVVHLADRFVNPLPSGPFHDLVMRTVSGGGAQKDVFPSLHTAAPTMLAVFSYRHRAHAPFRVTWIVVALFTLQIIGATIFLRWHWLVDVLAGLALAFTAVPLAAAIVDWEARRRASLGVAAAWPTLR
jgi:membrane-associated phospholipid phosphatase